MKFLQTDGGRRFSRHPNQDNDCTVRALAIVCHVSYDTAYRTLQKLGRRSNRPWHFPSKPIRHIGEAEVMGHYFAFCDNPNKLTPIKFLELNPHGRFVLDQPGHVFAAVNGVAFDDMPVLMREPLEGWWTVTKTKA